MVSIVIFVMCLSYYNYVPNTMLKHVSTHSG